jgi:hypothetical protein
MLLLTSDTAEKLGEKSRLLHSGGGVLQKMMTECSQSICSPKQLLRSKANKMHQNVFYRNMQCTAFLLNSI